LSFRPTIRTMFNLSRYKTGLLYLIFKNQDQAIDL
jgi:hypothetical protein